jgi:hypothetical protein
MLTSSRRVVLFSAPRGLWRYSLVTDKLSATMRIAKRVYSLARDQNDSALMIGAYRALAVTFYYLGDFESARQNAIAGVQIWRSDGPGSFRRCTYVIGPFSNKTTALRY